MKIKSNLNNSLTRRLARVGNAFKIAALKGYFEDDFLIRAASLSFSLILTIVPFVTLVLALGGFSVFEEQIERLVSAAFLPNNPNMLLIIESVNEFAEKALTLGAFGLIFFTLTSILLLNSIEMTFNVIFRAADKREPLRKITTYVTLIVLGSLFLSSDLINTISLPLAYVPDFLYYRSTSFLLVFFLLWLLYTMLPCARIGWRDALPGSLLTALLWFLVKKIFSLWMNTSAAYSVIYGSLFLVPIMLLWLYALWAVVLFGAQLVFATIHPHYQPQIEGRGNLSCGELADRELAVFFLVCRTYLAGQGAVNRNVLAKKARLTDLEIVQSVFSLQEAGYLKQVGNQIFPARSPDRVTVKEVSQALLRVAKPSPTAKKLLTAFTEKNAEIFDDVSVASFLEQNNQD